MVTFKEVDVELSSSTNCLLLLSLWPQECMEGYTMNTHVYDMWWRSGQSLICGAYLWNYEIRAGSWEGKLHQCFPGNAEMFFSVLYLGNLVRGLGMQDLQWPGM